jgi:hypothetical protein
MSIIYDLPRIGSAPPEGQPGGWRQKGPTCWYYSAKMIMKFHERLQKGNPDLEHVYEQWKQLHELRKVMTGIEDKSVRSDQAQVKKILIEKRDAIVAFLDGKGGNDLQLQGFKSELKALDQPKATIRLDRINQLLERIDKISGDFKVRIEALQSITSHAGFSTWELSDALASPAKAEEVLRMTGPFYASGALSVKIQGQVKNPPVKREGKLGNGDGVVAVYELKEDSAHAVVVVGVNGDSLFYKDPNGSSGVIAIPFATFANNVKKDGEMIFLDCRESKDDEWRCIHNRSKVLDQTHPLLAQV